MAEMEKQFSDMSVKILQRECDSLSREVDAIEKKLQAITSERESYANNTAIACAKSVQIADERKKIKEDKNKFTEEMNHWDSSIRQPLHHYKDMKQALSDLNAEQKMTQKFIIHVDIATTDVEKEIKNVKNSMEDNITKNSDVIQQAGTENKGLISGLQTQLKLIETRKRTMESQLQQKAEENKELTKICEELIKQRE